MTEHAKARAWRERRGLSREQLAELTGYSGSAILWFERGKTPPRTWKKRNKDARQSQPIADWVWQRFKMACAGVEAMLASKRQFEW